jgi:hypothetical protein
MKALKWIPAAVLAAGLVGCSTSTTHSNASGVPSTVSPPSLITTTTIAPPSTTALAPPSTTALACTPATDTQVGALKVTLAGSSADHIGEAFVADGPNGITYLAANIYDTSGTRVAAAWVGRGLAIYPLTASATDYSVFAATSFAVSPGTARPTPEDSTSRMLLDECVARAS